MMAFDFTSVELQGILLHQLLSIGDSPSYGGWKNIIVCNVYSRQSRWSSYDIYMHANGYGFVHIIKRLVAYYKVLIAYTNSFCK